MKLPSLKTLIHHASQTFFRFPFALLSASMGTVVAVVLVNQSGNKLNGALHNLLITAALGLPLFTTIPVFAEKRGWRSSINLLSQFAGALLLAAYFFSLPADVFESPSIHLIRFLLLNIGLHFLVAFAPYTGKNEITGFWQYNKTLFLRFLTAVLYSGVLYIGLAIALLAIEKLFGLDIDGKRYGQLWILIAGMFNTWFFLAGMPENLAALNDETHYPKGLKIFTQYILIPLVVIYLIILYAYEAKIIIQWDWPKGWVANLVLGFSVTGILSLLLVYPISDRTENKWIKTFSRWYYVALIPPVAMLLLAIWRRVSDYGITENRYFVLVLGVALAAVVLYFILSRKKSIKVIPITLCGLAFFSSFGPWGAFAVSERSQMIRLKEFLVKNGILVDGIVQKTSQPVALGDTKEISSMVSYLHRVHGLDAIQPWFKQDLKTLGKKPDTTATSPRYTTPSAVVGLMGISFVNEWETEASSRFYFTANQQETIDIAGYDYLIRYQDWSGTTTSHALAIGQENWTMRLDSDRSTLTLYNAEKDTDTLTLNLAPLLERLVQEYGASNTNTLIPANKMTLEQSNQNIKVKIFFVSISGQKSGDRLTINHLMADLFFGRASK
jgi:hypothetical protein